MGTISSGLKHINTAEAAGQPEGPGNLPHDNVQRFSFGGAAAHTSPLGFRSWDPRR
jgi:hypothetical protein